MIFCGVKAALNVYPAEGKAGKLKTPLKGLGGGLVCWL